MTALIVDAAIGNRERLGRRPLTAVRHGLQVATQYKPRQSKRTVHSHRSPTEKFTVAATALIGLTGCPGGGDDDDDD